MEVGGLFLVTDYEQERDGRVVFRGHGVYGWDPKGQRYSMTWCDSMTHGIPAICFGKWEGETLTFESAGEHGKARYIYSLDGSDRYVFRLEVSPDGVSWTPFLEGRYRKV